MTAVLTIEQKKAQVVSGFKGMVEKVEDLYSMGVKATDMPEGTEKEALKAQGKEIYAELDAVVVATDNVLKELYVEIPETEIKALQSDVHLATAGKHDLVMVAFQLTGVQTA